MQDQQPALLDARIVRAKFHVARLVIGDKQILVVHLSIYGFHRFEGRGHTGHNPTPFRQLLERLLVVECRIRHQHRQLILLCELGQVRLNRPGKAGAVR